MFWVLHILTSIRPSDEAAEVCIMPVCFFCFTVWINPSTVAGFTIPEAADATGTSSSITKNWEAVE